MKRFAMYLLMSLLAIAVLSFMGCAPTETRQAPGEYMDDATTTTKVKSAIFDDPDLKVLEISVETFRGEVQLSGFVSSEETAARAVAVAGSVSGVKAVRNDMQIR